MLYFFIRYHITAPYQAEWIIFESILELGISRPVASGENCTFLSTLGISLQCSEVYLQTTIILPSFVSIDQATSGAYVRISFPISNENERYIFTVCGCWRLSYILGRLPQMKNIIVMRTYISFKANPARNISLYIHTYGDIMFTGHSDRIRYLWARIDRLTISFTIQLYWWFGLLYILSGLHELGRTDDISVRQRVDNHMVHHNCVSRCTRYYSILRDESGATLSDTKIYIFEGQVRTSGLVPSCKNAGKLGISWHISREWRGNFSRFYINVRYLMPSLILDIDLRMVMMCRNRDMVCR